MLGIISINNFHWILLNILWIVDHLYVILYDVKNISLCNYKSVVKNSIGNETTPKCQIDVFFCDARRSRIDFGQWTMYVKRYNGPRLLRIQLGLWGSSSHLYTISLPFRRRTLSTLSSQQTVATARLFFNCTLT